MSVPPDVRKMIFDHIWPIADEKRWMYLDHHKKSHLYNEWSDDPEIGGVLIRYMEQPKIRVYLKDVVMKKYSQSILADVNRPFNILGIPEDVSIRKTYIKPHGRMLSDGRVISWGRIDEWKSIILSVYERAFQESRGEPYAAVLLYSTDKLDTMRKMVLIKDLAERLDIEKVIFLD